MALKADNNKYWTRIPSGTLTNFLAAQQTYKSDATTFRRENLDTGKSRFWSASVSSYLCRVNRGGKDYIEAVSNRNDAGCEFTVDDSGTGWARIKADNGKYLCRVTDGATEFIMASGSSSCDMFQEVL